VRWTHLSSGQLVDYFSREWLPEQEAAIETHLAGCDSCAQNASVIFEVLGFTDSWTAHAQERTHQAHGVPAHREYAGSTRSA
jgi:hypothetical protein